MSRLYRASLNRRSTAQVIMWYKQSERESYSRRKHKNATMVEGTPRLPKKQISRSEY